VCTIPILLLLLLLLLLLQLQCFMCGLSFCVRARPFFVSARPL
jgi:hypothetical protein